MTKLLFYYLITKYYCLYFIFFKLFNQSLISTPKTALIFVLSSTLYAGLFAGLG